MHRVSALVSGSSRPASSPSREHCVVLLGKTLFSPLASLHPRVQNSTGEFEIKCWRYTAMDQHPIRGEENTPTRFMLCAWWATWLVCKTLP